jgi:hypothetical protein
LGLALLLLPLQLPVLHLLEASVLLLLVLDLPGAVQLQLLVLLEAPALGHPVLGPLAAAAVRLAVY